MAKFNGETLDLLRKPDGNPYSFKTKSDAQKVASAQRKKGFLARVIDHPYFGWAVYVKEKTYRAHHMQHLKNERNRKIRITR